MKKIVYFLFLLVACCVLTSCYAFIHANELTYQSSLGRKSDPTITVQSDSVSYDVSTAE